MPTNHVSPRWLAQSEVTVPFLINSSRLFRGIRSGRRVYAYILHVVKIVKVRRVGNSNVVSLPHELENRGFTPGTEVVVDDLPSGELRITLVAAVRDVVRHAARQSISEHRRALDLLAEHDRKG